MWKSLVLIIGFASIYDCSILKSKNLIKLSVDFIHSQYLRSTVAFSCTNPLMKVWNIDSIKDIQLKDLNWIKLIELMPNGSSVSSIVDILRIDMGDIAVLYDLNCPHTEVLFEQVSVNKMFNASYHWLLITNNYTDAKQKLLNQNINADAEITLALLDDEDFNVASLWDVHNQFVKYNQPNVYTSKGIWTSSEGMKIWLTESKVLRRKNFNGIVLRALTVITILPRGRPQKEFSPSMDHPALDPIHRFHYNIFKHIAERYNFSYNLKRTPLWGFKPNDTWTGAIGTSMRQEIDIGVYSLRLTTQRVGAFLNTGISFRLNFGFIFRHPRLVDSKAAFLRPFELTVWILILVTIIVLGLFLKKAMDYEKRISKNYLHETSGIKDSSWAYSMLITFGTLTLQGFSGNVELPSTRIILLFIAIFSVIIYQFYSAFIVGFLLTKPPKTINSLEALYNSKMAVGMADLTYNWDILSLSMNPVMGDILQNRIKRDNNVVTFTKGIELIKKGGFAYHSECSEVYSALLEALTEEEICDLHQVDSTPRTPSTSPLPLGSPLKEYITVIMRRMFETGIYQYWINYWDQDIPPCPNDRVIVLPVDIEHFWTALGILGIGMMVSITAFLIEIIVHHIEVRKSKKI